MKFFIDTANVEQIKEAVSLGVLDGVTTNPTLIAKEQGKPDDILKQICDVVAGPVNAEVLSIDAAGMVKEGIQLQKIAKNIVIKIPMGVEGLKAVHILEKEEGIPTTTTLIFSPMQALVAAKAGTSYLCPFVGRLDDVGHFGMDIIEDILTIVQNYDFECEVLAASLRHPTHVLEAALAGVDICTIPWKVMEQLFLHPLTNIGLEQFLKDWEKVPK